VFRRRNQEDSEKLFELSDRLARQVGTILEGAYFQPVATETTETMLDDDTLFEWVRVAGGPELTGRTLADLDFRESTGAAVVAVQRDDETESNPGADTTVHGGDTLVVIGSREACDRVERLAAATDDPEERAVYRGSRYFGLYLDVDSQELFVIRAVGVTVLVAGAALALGVSEAVAAFFIGMGFSSTEHLHDLETRLTPIRDVFAAVFFFWIGLNTDPAVFADLAVAGLLVVLVVVTTPTKLFSGFLGGRIYGLDGRRSLRTAFRMVTRGEFSLVIAALAAGSGGSVVLSETNPSVAVGYVLVVSVLGTILMQYSELFERFVVERSASPGE